MCLSHLELLSRKAPEKSELATELLAARADAAVSPGPMSRGAKEGLHPARVSSDAISRTTVQEWRVASLAIARDGTRCGHGLRNGEPHARGVPGKRAGCSA